MRGILTFDSERGRRRRAQSVAGMRERIPRVQLVGGGIVAGQWVDRREGIEGSELGAFTTQYIAIGAGEQQVLTLIAG